jgi:predicted nucleic acid-binding protein
MENRYLLDTNVLIYYSNGILDAKEFVDEILENSFNISIISKIEFLGWAGYRGNNSEYELASKFLSNAFLFHLDDTIAEEAISMRQKTSVKIPDSIIAATARVYELSLVTANVDDFKKLGIEVFDPFS